VGAARDDQHAAAGERRRTRRTLRARGLLRPEDAAERAREAGRADEQERPRAEEERPHRALEIRIRLAVAHEDLRAVRACRCDRGRQLAADGVEPELRDLPPAGRAHHDRDARVADRMMRVACERGLVHGDAADHLPALLRRPPDLGDRGQDERLVDAERVHRGRAARGARCRSS
jgi:hypothetical protein